MNSFNVKSNQLCGGAAKREPGIEASVRDGFSETVPSFVPYLFTSHSWVGLRTNVNVIGQKL
ncbi:hypothetical protein E2C01_011134 [Portunus trituberculatus]|uniref:Uncharacterized protein n=1 Tax=Portunus trituberculatus TaxID=210409 RepID=A0A5B7DAW4_PORTR|nr:hypothetical protein [Portunus trituberculatus]